MKDGEEDTTEIVGQTCGWKEINKTLLVNEYD